MKKLVSVLLTLVVVLGLSLTMAAPVAAQDDPPNTVASSTMIFQGTLTYDSATGAYTGQIDMVNETAMDLGDKIAGFDVYAKWGGCAYVLDYYGTGEWNCNGTDTAIIGSNHDAYSSGGPWGPWYDPDCADWDQYSLELTADHWYLRYTATQESPMSGVMDWNAMYAAETDKGTEDLEDDGGPFTVYEAGGPQMWDWNAGAQVERIPLQFPGFDVSISGSGTYTVTLTPAAAGSTVLTANVPDITAISVDPTSIDFGDLLPGQSVSGANITVENIGTVKVSVDAELDPLTGTVFNRLKLDGAYSSGYSGAWVPIISSLSPNVSELLTTELVVPAGYTPKGPESATLIFTATAIP